MTLTPRWLQDFLRRPSRADLLARVRQLTEERDTFEERVYDSQWHLERARTELAAEQARFKEMMAEESARVEERLAGLRLAAKADVDRAQASSKRTRELLEDRVAALGDLPKKHDRVLAELHAERTELALAKDVIESLRCELSIANQYKPLYQSMLADVKKPKAKK